MSESKHVDWSEPQARSSPSHSSHKSSLDRRFLSTNYPFLERSALDPFMYYLSEHGLRWERLAGDVSFFYDLSIDQLQRVARHTLAFPVTGISVFSPSGEETTQSIKNILDGKFLLLRPKHQRHGSRSTASSTASSIHEDYESHHSDKASDHKHSSASNVVEMTHSSEDSSKDGSEAAPFVLGEWLVEIRDSESCICEIKYGSIASVSKCTVLNEEKVEDQEEIMEVMTLTGNVWRFVFPSTSTFRSCLDAFDLVSSLLHAYSTHEVWSNSNCNMESSISDDTSVPFKKLGGRHVSKYSHLLLVLHQGRLLKGKRFVNDIIQTKASYDFMEECYCVLMEDRLLLFNSKSTNIPRRVIALGATSAEDLTETGYDLVEDENTKYCFQIRLSHKENAGKLVYKAENLVGKSRWFQALRIAKLNFLQAMHIKNVIRGDDSLDVFLPSVPPSPIAKARSEHLLKRTRLAPEVVGAKSSPKLKPKFRGFLFNGTPEINTKATDSPTSSSIQAKVMDVPKVIVCSDALPQAHVLDSEILQVGHCNKTSLRNLWKLKDFFENMRFTLFPCDSICSSEIPSYEEWIKQSSALLLSRKYIRMIDDKFAAYHKVMTKIWNLLKGGLLLCIDEKVTSENQLMCFSFPGLEKENFFVGPYSVIPVWKMFRASGDNTRISLSEWEGTLSAVSIGKELMQTIPEMIDGVHSREERLKVSLEAATDQLRLMSIASYMTKKYTALAQGANEFFTWDDVKMHRSADYALNTELLQRSGSEDYFYFNPSVERFHNMVHNEYDNIGKKEDTSRIMRFVCTPLNYMDVLRLLQLERLHFLEDLHGEIGVWFDCNTQASAGETRYSATSRLENAIKQEIDNIRNVLSRLPDHQSLREQYRKAKGPVSM